MPDEFRVRPPAALPAISFALGLALAPALVAPRAAAAGFALVALIGAAFPEIRRGAPAILLLAAGIGRGTVAEQALRHDREVLAQIPSARFAAVRVPLERGWEPREDHARLRARRFLLEHGESWERVDLPLTLSLWAAAPDPGAATALRAEGLLRCSESGCRMSVKSARLVHFEGRLPWWSPAGWNRAAYGRIRAIGGASEPARRGAAQAAALALGRGELLDPAVREAYRRGGTYHLLVFSGMQIAFAAGTIAAVFRRMGRPRPGDWILLAIAIVAPPFAGNDPSVSRSAMMIGLYAASRLLRRPTSIENLLFVSAGTRLAMHPGELAAPGFALTYGATAGLILLGSRLAAERTRPWSRALAYGVGAELGTAPVTAHFFHQLVAGSSIVTILAAPVVTLMLAISAAACIAAFASPTLARILLEIVGRLDTFTVAVNLAVADRLGLARIVASPPAAVVAAAFLAALGALLALRRGVPLAVALLLLPLAWSFTAGRIHSRVDGFEIEMLDVGQGDAILLRSGRRAILVDGGGRRNDPTFGRDVLLPMLADRGIRRIDAVVLTHGDPDHCAGLLSVLQATPVREVWMSTRHFREPCPAALFDQAVTRRIAVVPVDRRRPHPIPPFRIDVWTAEPPFRRSHANNSSIVLRVRAEGRTALLTGDLERPAEFQLLESAPWLLPCDVLKVAHHGSASSSSDSFLRAARPRLALIPAGRNNPFGHPSAEVTGKLERGGAAVYRTDVHGNIRVRVKGGLIRAERQIDTGPAAGRL